MVKLQCSVLLLLCATCTLGSATIRDELNFLSNDAPVIRTRRQNPINSHHVTPPIDFGDIKNRFENAVDACGDAFSLVCNNNQEIVNKTMSVKTVRNIILDILNSAPDENDSAALSIEKSLFRNCMKLGEEDYNTKARTLADFEYLLHRVYNHINSHPSWQSLDILLSSLGFDHAFYEIKVEKDPENILNNIVTLQPPSYARTRSTVALIKRILNTPKDYGIEERWNIWQYFETMKRNKDDIESFLDALLALSANRVVNHVEKTTLNSWQEHNNLNLSDVAQINWANVISKDFERVNVEIDTNNEVLLIKNKQYFLNLYGLLNSTTNHLASWIVTTKMLVEQLPYVDWEHFQDLKIVVKENFCFEETKLYGASSMAVRRMKKEKSNGISSEIINMLNNIIHAINTDISGAYIALSAKQRRFLKNELKSMTMNILQKNDGRDVANYYGDYRLIHIYFSDIREYREIIRNKELSTLRDTSRAAMDETELYSIVDLHKPRNRLLTKLLTTEVNVEMPMNREIMYGIFGADLAQFLYSLLNENKFAEYKHDFVTTDLELRTYPIFSKSIIDCYRNSMSQHNQNEKFIKHMLTTMFGLHIAYEAMWNDYTAAGKLPEGIHVSQRKWISYDEVFFISYLKSHCSLGSSLLNEMFLKFDMFRKSMCKDRRADATGCKQQPFDVQSKHIFLN